MSNKKNIRIDFETGQQYVTFITGRELYAIDVMLVESIERVTEITPVPKTGEHILGIINIRGDIVPVISLRRRFSMADTEHTEDTRVIITKYSEYRVGILVDEVKDVYTVDPQRIQTGEDIFKEGNGELISGVIEYGGEYALALDVPAVLGLNE